MRPQDDKSGSLTKRELRRALAALKLDPLSVNELLLAWDGDDDDSVSYEEWIDALKARPDLKEAMADRAKAIVESATKGKERGQHIAQVRLFKHPC